MFTIECAGCGKSLKRGESIGISTGFLCHNCFFKCEQCIEEKGKPYCTQCRITEDDKKRIQEM